MLLPLLQDFTRQFHVGTSCHDIQSTQGADQSGVYLVHPANLVQGPWKVFCDLETEGGGWTVSSNQTAGQSNASRSVNMESKNINWFLPTKSRTQL